MGEGAEDKKGDTKGRRQGRPRGRCIPVWVTEEEYLAISGKANDSGQSLSGYLRAVGLRRKLNPVSDVQVMSDVLKVNADIGRLGGLIKLWLSDRKQMDVSRESLQKTLDEVRSLSSVLRDTAGRLLP